MKAISCIAMSPDDQLVASGDYKGRIVIREMNLRRTDESSMRSRLVWVCTQSAFLQTGRSSLLDIETHDPSV
jgi:hypothetical protein